MTDEFGVGEQISEEQLTADGEALRKRMRHLRLADPCEGWVYEPPDVVGGQRIRDKYRRAMPDLSEDELDEYVDLYQHHLSPATRRSYKDALEPFYRAAERAGFDPLDCDPTLIAAHISHLMGAGKVGPNGKRDPKKPYSLTYFKRFLAAHRMAVQAKGLPEMSGGVDLDKLLRAYHRKRGAELPRNSKKALLAREMAAIERNAREGCLVRAATERAAVALGCDPDLDLGVARLLRLRFADVALREDHMALDTTTDGVLEKVFVMARPGDSACPVAALTSLRKARHNAMRAQLGCAPTDDQMDAQHVFANARTDAPLTPPGLKHIVNEACDGVARNCVISGGLPQLEPELRRKAVALGVDTRTASNLMMISHTAFASARVGETALFDVGDFEVFGRDQYGKEHFIPLVDVVRPDGKIVKGMLNRISVIAVNDLLDHAGTSMYASGAVLGVHNRFKHGTKTQDTHENYYPAQPGHPACPVRLLIQGVAACDRLMVMHHGRRLSAEDPLYTNLDYPGRRYTAKQLSDVLGEIVKKAVIGLGLDPRHYSSHSLRKVRATYVFSKGGSQLNVMQHDGRSSEASNLPYVQIDPRNPFAGDPVVDFYADADDGTPRAAGAETVATPTAAAPPLGCTPAPSLPQHEQITDGQTPMPARDTKAVAAETVAEPPAEPPDREIADPPTPAQTASETAADPAAAVARWITDFRLCAERLRSAGLDDSAIAALAGLKVP